MNTPLSLALLGAAIGGGVVAAAEGSGKEIAAGAVSGAAGGRFAGEVADGLVRLYRGQKLINKLRGHKAMSPRDMRKVLRLLNKAKLPVYMQSKGPSIGNAYYTDRAMSFPAGVKFKDVLTGKEPTKDTRKAIYIGKGFDKLPILAHELGHAYDYRDKPWYWRPLQYASVGMSLAGVGTGMAVGLGAVRPEQEFAASALGAGLLLAGSVLGSEISRHDERVASDLAMQTLAKVQKQKQQESSRSLLDAAYATYEPIQIFSKPDFGSGDYATAPA